MILFGEGGAEEALFETALMQQLVALASTQYMTVFALVTNDGSLLDDSEPLILTIVFWVLYPPLTTNMRHLVTQTDHERYAQCKQLEITDLVFAVLSALLSLINLRVGNHFLLIAYVAVAYYHRTVRPLGTPAFALAAYTVLLVPSDRYFPMAIYMIGAQSLTAYYNRLSRAVAGSENAIIVTRLTVAILVGRTLLFSEPYVQLEQIWLAAFFYINAVYHKQGVRQAYVRCKDEPDRCGEGSCSLCNNTAVETSEGCGHMRWCNRCALIECATSFQQQNQWVWCDDCHRWQDMAPF